MPDTTPVFQLLYPLTWAYQIKAKFDDPANYSGSPGKLQKREGMMFTPLNANQTLEVRAAQRGVVQEIGNYSTGYGTMVRITHAWYGETYVTWYGNMAPGSVKVKPGDYVNAGTVLGNAGKSGGAPQICLFFTLQWIGKGKKNYVINDVIDPQPLLVTAVASRDEAWFDADVTIPDGTVKKTGELFKKIWRIRNAGTTTWGSGYTLSFHSGNTLGPGTDVPLPAAKPGELVQVALDMVAPQVIGEYRSDWIAKNPQGETFSHRLYTIINVQASQQPVDVSLARWDADVTIPDGQILKPGEQFTKIWRVLNDGKTTWDASYQLAFFKDEKMGGPDSVSLPALRPRQKGNVAVNLTAPQTPGHYRSTWKPRDPSGKFFDYELFAEIVVQKPEPQNTQLLFSSPVRGNYSIGWRYMVPVPYLDGTHKGVDFLGAIGLQIVAGGKGIVHMSEPCEVCTPDRPNFNSHNLTDAQRTQAFNNLNPWTWGFGNLVIVRYSWNDLPVNARAALTSIGANGWYAYVYYAHLHQIYVGKGQQVTAETIIGTMGNTGNSTAPHLHLEIRAAASPTNTNNYKRIDPLKMFME